MQQKSKKSKKKNKGRGPSSTAPKTKLRTSADVYQRIKWDQEYDASEYVIEYEDRFLGIQEIDLLEYEPGGDIPFHRIWVFKKADSGAIVWNRKKRIDLIYDSGDTTPEDHTKFDLVERRYQEKLNYIEEAAAEEAGEEVNTEKDKTKPDTTDDITDNTAVEPKTDQVDNINNNKDIEKKATMAYRKGKKVVFRDLPWFRFDNGDWLEIDPQKNTAVESPTHRDKLRVVTWNILVDYYHTDQIRTTTRIPHILSILENLKCDIICLEEVTLPFWQAMLKEKWVRDSFFVSESRSGNSITPYGQTILSTIPFNSLRLGRFSRHKCVPIAQLEINSRKMFLAPVHLTSSTKSAIMDTSAKQAYQFLAILKAISGKAGVPDAIIAGDFNFGDGDKNEKLFPADFTDIGKGTGFTYDPIKNTVAAIMSTSGTCNRLDRILLRSAANAWVAQKVWRIGMDPIDTDDTGMPTLYPSDHFGLCADLIFQTSKSSTLDNHDHDDADDETDELIQALQKADVCESKESAERRSEAIAFIRAICRKIVLPYIQAGEEEEEEKDDDEEETNQQVFFTLGSCALGVTGDSSDVDALVIGPAASLDHTGFFAAFTRACQNETAVSHIRIAHDAIVPIAKLKVLGVPFDLLYAGYPAKVSPTIRPSELSDEQIQLFDSASMRSLMGVRDTRMILRIVKIECGGERGLRGFRVLLRAVRHWARVRGVYSAPLGYFGGIAWALLVVYFLQQRNSAATGSSHRATLAAFFAFYAKFAFAKKSVAVTKTGRRYSRKAFPKDAIVVPTVCAPAVNCIRNASASSLKVLRWEFEIAREKLSNGANAVKSVWKKSRFFVEYPRYITVTVRATKRDDVRSAVGFLESRLVSLLFSLEKIFRNDDQFQDLGDKEGDWTKGFIARPITAHFTNLKSTVTDSHPYSATYVIGLQFAGDAAQLESVHVRGVVRQFESEYEQWRERPASSEISAALASVEDIAQLVPKRCLAKNNK